MAEHSTTTATTHAPAAPEHAEATAFGLDPPAWIALAMIVVLGLLIWKKVPAAIGAALDRKIAGIREQLAEAAQVRADAEALKAEYQAKAAHADAEAATILARAKAEAEGIVRQAEADAAAVVERRTRMAEDKIAAAERTAVDEIRGTAARAATAAAESLIRDKVDAKADKPMVDATIAGLGKR